MMSLTSSPSSLLIICPYHLSSSFLTFSVISTTSYHLLISSFCNVSDQLSFISSYYVSIPSQPIFPNLLCNVYHSLSSSTITCPYHLFRKAVFPLKQINYIYLHANLQVVSFKPTKRPPYKKLIQFQMV